MNWVLLKNSVFVAGLTTLLACALGFLAALWLVGLKASWRNRFLALGVIAFALPPFLVSNCWLDLAGSGGGRSWLPFNLASTGGTVLLLSLIAWPIPLLAVWSAWRRLEPAQLESDPAVTGWQLIRGLLWPSSRSALTQAAVLVFVLALNNFAVPAILQVKVFPAEMWVRFTATLDAAGAFRLSWPLVVGPMLLLLWLRRRDVPWPRFSGPASPLVFRQQLGSAWWLGCGTLTMLVCLLSVGLPVVRLLAAQRTWSELPAAFAAGTSAVNHSFWCAAFAASLVIGLGLAGTAAQAFSLGHANIRNRATQFLGWILWLPFLVPGVLLGIGLIAVFNRSWTSAFYQSSGIVILAFAIRYVAAGWHGAEHAFQAADRDLLDAARLEGVSRWQMARYVLIPQIGATLAAAWYIVFLLCLWDVESMILIVPPGGETLAVRIFNFLHYGHNAQVNALCLVLLALALAPLILWKAGSYLISMVPSKPSWRSAACFASAGLLATSGCTPGAGSNSRDIPLQSRTFSRAVIIGTRGVGAGELNKPRSVAVDRLDNVYAVDMTGRVQKFSPAGQFQLLWQMPQTDLGKPKGMCRDRDGNIVVLEPHYQRVNHFSTDGHLVAQWGHSGTNAGELKLPRAVAVNSRGEMFVSEYGPTERIQKFSPPAQGSKLLLGFGKPGSGPGEFNRAEGLFVDAQDRLYVADSCNHRIQVFSNDGQFIRAYGKPGTGPGELSYPYDICVDASGRQYVCEFGNSRIQVFDASDKPIEIIGGPGAAPGQFSNPWGVALDSAGNLYVADALNHRVQKLVRRSNSDVAALEPERGPSCPQQLPRLAATSGHGGLVIGITTYHPQGMTDNSPRFQPWVGVEWVPSPEGTAEILDLQPSLRDSGSSRCLPGVETLGYSRWPLRGIAALDPAQ
jgi:ABC-type Fe3+ transport system permease subunit/DNA-binding beta-propeller fold protein YncE